MAGTRELSGYQSGAGWRRHGARVKTLAVSTCALALFLPSCTTESDPNGEIRSKQQQVVVSTTLVSFELPAGPGLGELALVAASRLKIEDRVKVVDPDGAPAAVGNSGTQESVFGVESRVGLVRSVAPIEVRDRGGILGDAYSAGGITLRNGAFVTGTRHPDSTEVTPPVTESLELDLGGVYHGNRNIEPPNGGGERVTDLAPGVYGSVNIKSRNRVNLVSGNYVFDHFHMEPQTRLVVDDAHGPIFINVKNSFGYKGKIESESGEHPALRLVYLGQNMMVVEQSFAGTLLAPNASVRLATPSSWPRQHVGSFFAKNLEVSPDVKVVFRPYLTYEAEQEWEVETTDHGSFGLSAATADGSIVSKTAQNVVLISADGVASDLFAPERKRFRVDENSGEFGFYSQNTFEAYSPTGSYAGGHPMTLPGFALFVPGSADLILIDGEGEHGSSRWTGFRLVTGGTPQPVVSTPGMREFAAGPGELVYTTEEELVCVEYGGAERWRIPRPLIEIALSHNGETLIGTYSEGGPRVVHVDVSDGSVTAPVELPSAPFALDVSPSGEYSLVALKNQVFFFQNGTQKRVLDLPMEYFTSSDMNDEGEMLIGGSNASGETLVQLVGESGTGSWLEEPGSVDRGAYRPHVRFRPSSSDFIVVRRSGVASYNTKKGL